MSTGRLTPFSYVVLALVGEGGAGAHDLVASMRHGRPYWTDSPRHFYSEPKRLAKLGYLTACKQPGITRERTIYALTDKGRKALREWIPRPSHFPRIQNEALARLVAGYLVDDHALWTSFDALREDLDQVRAGLANAEAFAQTLPEHERYLRLVHNLGRRIIDAVDEWLIDVEAELAPQRKRQSNPKASRAHA